MNEPQINQVNTTIHNDENNESNESNDGNKSPSMNESQTKQVNHHTTTTSPTLGIVQDKDHAFNHTVSPDMAYHLFF